MQSRFALPAELTIYAIAELLPPWLASVDAALRADAAEEVFVVDAGAVCEIDAAGVQLLLSLSNTLARDGWTLRLASPSETLAKACAALGVDALLATKAADTAEAAQ